MCVWDGKNVVCLGREKCSVFGTGKCSVFGTEKCSAFGTGNVVCLGRENVVCLGWENVVCLGRENVSVFGTGRNNHRHTKGKQALYRVTGGSYKQPPCMCVGMGSMCRYR